MNKKLLLIYTGGTIGMMENQETGVLEPFDFDNLLQQIPQLHTIDAVIHSLSVPEPKDSADMHPQDWQFMAKLVYDHYQDYHGFVILHGTDTMAYSATALSFMLQNLQKPVIFTGSQLPIGNLRTDAVENVLTAIQLALVSKNKATLLNEVGLYFNNTLFRANRSTKISAHQFKAFDSPNYLPLATSGVSLKIHNELVWKPDLKSALQLKTAIDTGVFLLKIHPGITKTQIDVLFKALDFKVLILETYGSGTLFSDAWFLESLARLRTRGIMLISCSQCVQGGVVEGAYASSQKLQDLKVISAGDMTTEAALIKAMHLLAYTSDNTSFVASFTASISGEIS